MLFIGISIGVFLIALGLLIHLGKNYDLIAGYNTMNEAEKSAFNIIKFARLFGITFYIMGITLIIFSFVLALFDIDNGYFVGVMLVIIFGGVGYLNLMGQIIKRQVNP